MPLSSSFPAHPADHLTCRCLFNHTSWTLLMWQNMRGVGENKVKERYVLCIHRFVFIIQWCHFQSLLKLVLPAVSLVTWIHVSISPSALEAAHRSSLGPLLAFCREAGKQYTARRRGSPKSPPAARVCRELREAIRPNNLSRSPNCFLLLTKNHTSSSGSPQGNLCLLWGRWAILSSLWNAGSLCQQIQFQSIDNPPPASWLGPPSLQSWEQPPFLPWPMGVLVLRMPGQQVRLGVAQSHWQGLSRCKGS